MPAQGAGAPSPAKNAWLPARQKQPKLEPPPFTTTPRLDVSVSAIQLELIDKFVAVEEQIAAMMELFQKFKDEHACAPGTIEPEDHQGRIRREKVETGLTQLVRSHGILLGLMRAAGVPCRVASPQPEHQQEPPLAAPIGYKWER